ncbi:hypothetical protein AGIG_G1220 [Arapaima gigas]
MYNPPHPPRLGLQMPAGNDSLRFCVWGALQGVLGDAQQPLVTLSQMVPGSPAALPDSAGTDRAAATHTCGHTTLTLQAEGTAWRAVDTLARWAVQRVQGLPSGSTSLLIRHMVIQQYHGHHSQKKHL